MTQPPSLPLLPHESTTLHVLLIFLCVETSHTYPLLLLHLSPLCLPVVHTLLIPRVSLDTPITDQDIAVIAKDYLVRWEELSPHLELTVQQEHSIQQTYRIYEDQKREALHMWKRNKGNGATYNSFITAAETISNMQLADNVRALLKKGTQEASTGVRITTAIYLLDTCILASPHE